MHGLKKLSNLLFFKPCIYIEISLTAYFDVNAWLEKEQITELLPGRYPVELTVNLPEYSRMQTPLLATLVVSEIQPDEDAEQNN